MKDFTFYFLQSHGLAENSILQFLPLQFFVFFGNFANMSRTKTSRPQLLTRVETGCCILNLKVLRSNSIRFQCADFIRL